MQTTIKNNTSVAGFGMGRTGDIIQLTFKACSDYGMNVHGFMQNCIRSIIMEVDCVLRTGETQRRRIGHFTTLDRARMSVIDTMDGPLYAYTICFNDLLPHAPDTLIYTTVTHHECPQLKGTMNNLPTVLISEINSFVGKCCFYSCTCTPSNNLYAHAIESHITA
jgi:hypothetical protein